MKKILSFLMFTLATSSCLFAQKFEESVEIEFLEGSDSIMASFQRDFTAEYLTKAIASKITKYEIKRFQSPYGSTPLESIVGTNKKASISTSTKTAKITFTHANQTMAARMAKLCATEYIEYQKILMHGAEVEEIAGIDSALEELEKEIKELDKQASFISASASEGKSLSNEKINIALRKRNEANDKKNSLYKRKNQILREITKTRVPVVIKKN